MDIKIDRYEIYDELKVHEILVFPKLGHMRGYDDYPRESPFDIDGSIEDMKRFAIVLTALIDDPSKLVYFPIKTVPARIYYLNCGHLLITGSDSFFKNSK